MPTLLALDTSTEACSAALLRNGAISERYIEAPREHMLRLLPMVDELLIQEQLELRDLDGIVFTRGPGSFTGLRITLGVVQGLAFGANLPVLPVSTLAVLAQTAANVQLAGRFILSAIDARMDEVYCAWFEVGADGLVRACSEERVCAPEAVAAMATNEPWLGVGSGWNYAARLPAAGRGGGSAACRRSCRTRTPCALAPPARSACPSSCGSGCRRSPACRRGCARRA